MTKYHQNFTAKSDRLASKPLGDNYLSLAVSPRIKMSNAACEACGLKLQNYPYDQPADRKIEGLGLAAVAVRPHRKSNANAKFGLPETGLQVRSPFERMEIDEWQIDVRNLAIDTGRAKAWTDKPLGASARRHRTGKEIVPSIQVAVEYSIDVAARMIVNFRFREAVQWDVCASGSDPIATIGLGREFRNVQKSSAPKHPVMRHPSTSRL